MHWMNLGGKTSFIQLFAAVKLTLFSFILSHFLARIALSASTIPLKDTLRPVFCVIQRKVLEQPHALVVRPVQRNWQITRAKIVQPVDFRMNVI